MKESATRVHIFVFTVITAFNMNFEIVYNLL